MNNSTLRKIAIAVALLAVFVSQFLLVGHSQAKAQACSAIDVPGQAGVFVVTCPRARS